MYVGAWILPRLGLLPFIKRDGMALDDGVGDAKLGCEIGFKPVNPYRSLRSNLYAFESTLS